jgi:hypothetical protein
MAAPGESLHGGLDGGWVLRAPGPRTANHTRSIACRSVCREPGLEGGHVMADGRGGAGAVSLAHPGSRPHRSANLDE